MLYTKLFFCIFLVFIINEVNAAPSEQFLQWANSRLKELSELLSGTKQETQRAHKHVHASSLTPKKHHHAGGKKPDPVDPGVDEKPVDGGEKSDPPHDPKRDVEEIDPAIIPTHRKTPKRLRTY